MSFWSTLKSCPICHALCSRRCDEPSSCTSDTSQYGLLVSPLRTARSDVADTTRSEIAMHADVMASSDAEPGTSSGSSRRGESGTAPKRSPPSPRALLLWPLVFR